MDKLTLMFLFILMVPFSTEAQKNGTVHWISNAGFYIDLPDGDILIDAILNSNDEIAKAEGRFSDVRLIFVSHVHGDHFNAKGIIRHMLANTKTHLIITPESLTVLKRSTDITALEDRITVSYPGIDALESFEANGFSGHIVRLEHSGVQNIGFGLKKGGFSTVYINGSSKSEDTGNSFKQNYKDVNIAIVNKWPLANSAYIDNLAKEVSPSLLLMAHHNGAQDTIIETHGGKEQMENLMTRASMKGVIFIKRMESRAF